MNGNNLDILASPAVGSLPRRTLSRLAAHPMTLRVQRILLQAGYRLTVSIEHSMRYSLLSDLSVFQPKHLVAPPFDRGQVMANKDER